jgi:hypothetical protein
MKKKSNWLSILLFTTAMLFSNAARSEEIYMLSGQVDGPSVSSPAAVLGWDSKPLWHNFRLELEGQVLDYWQGVGVGTRFDLGEHWHLLVGTGAGVLNAGLDRQSDGFNFLLQGGLAYRWKNWRAEARIHHISNAQLRQPNSGINGALFLIGYRF